MAEVRSRVEALADEWETSPNAGKWHAARLRAAVAAADTPQNARPQGPRIDAQDHPRMVAHSEDSRPSEQYDSE